MSQGKESKAVAADHLPSFKSLHQVLQHLKNAGYKIGKSKLYGDAKKGGKFDYPIKFNPGRTKFDGILTLQLRLGL